jgi:hypothetical protein
MTFKFGKKLTRTYSEISQPNPLRWEILWKDEADKFHPQSGNIKCKDFFNDLVSKIMGDHTFEIYGFNSATTKINDDGVWFRLSHIDNPDQFMENAEKAINVKLMEQTDGNVRLSLFKLPRKKVLVFIPKYLFTKTYLTSLVTYMLRLCNYGVSLTSFESAISDASVAYNTDNAIKGNGRALALKWAFKVPAEYDEFWYWSGPQYNSKLQPKPAYAGVIHNNGVMSWSNYIVN